MENPDAAVFHKQLGDLVLLQPALRRISDRTGKPVELLTRPEFSGLVSLMPGAILPSSRRFHTLWSFDASSRSLWHSLRTAAGHKLLACPPQHGMPRLRDLAVFHEFRFRSSKLEYRSEFYWKLAGDNDGATFLPPRLNPPPESWTRGLKLPPAGSWVLVHVTSGYQRKCWNTEGWSQVLLWLRSRGIPFRLGGGPQDWERQHAADIARSAGLEEKDILAGRTDLGQYIGLTAQAGLTVTVDGSAAHLAAAFGRKTLVLFGPTNATHWHRPSPDHIALRAEDFSSDHKPPASAIPADRVIESLDNLWRSSSRP